MRINVYIDIEGAGAYPVELACIAIPHHSSSSHPNFGKPIEQLHCFCRCGLDNPNFSIESRVCHGITASVVKRKGVSFNCVITLLRQFLRTILSYTNDISIYGNGDDITKESLTKMFPGIPEWDYIHDYQQIRLPTWEERAKTNYYEAAYAIKQRATTSPSPCSPNNHPVPITRMRPITTANQAAKLAYGFHCAFSDALQIAMVNGDYPMTSIATNCV